jgi:acetyltransferase-like isoleucine patch superfamily enzyme
MLRKLRMIIVTLLIRVAHPFGLSVHGFQDLRFDTELVIKNNGRINLGKSTTTYKRVTLAANGGSLRLGDYVFFNRNSIIASLCEITIGNNCIFGPGVIIYDHDHKFNYQGIVHGEYHTGPIMIEDNCWIGANVTILRGTHIGERCIIGAGTVVKGIIPPHSIVTSNRGMIIKPIEEKK